GATSRGGVFPPAPRGHCRENEPALELTDTASRRKVQAVFSINRPPRLFASPLYSSSGSDHSVTFLGFSHLFMEVHKSGDDQSPDYNPASDGPLQAVTSNGAPR